MKAGNIMKAWGGIAGLQSCMDVMFDEAVQKRGMSLPMFGKLMATNAADIFGLQQKAVSPQKDADFVFIQPNSSYVLTNDDLEYRHKVSPYVGRTIGARITKTILRGDVIYDIEQGFLLRRKVNLSLNISSNQAPAMPVLAAGILRLRCVYVQFCSQPRKPVIRISVVFLYFATRLWFLLRYFLLFSCRKVACLRSRNMLFLLPHWPASLRRFAVIVALLWKGRVACGGEPSLLSPLVKHRAGHRSTISPPAWQWGLHSPAC